MQKQGVYRNQQTTNYKTLNNKLKFGDVKHYQTKYSAKPPVEEKSYFKPYGKPAPSAYSHMTYETIEIDDNMMMVPVYIL